jgi:hypothetical protein
VIQPEGAVRGTRNSADKNQAALAGGSANTE